MDFISNSEHQVKEMLKTIGIDSIDQLFTAIPKSILLKPPSHDDGISEFEGLKLMEALANKNTFPFYDNYMGGGSYEHHIPAIVSAICSKSEFLTAYTPYQAEASQGLLQSIFEFQSSICALTGMDVANASVYDGGSACAEGCLMALRAHKERTKVVISNSVNPNYRGVTQLYLDRSPFEVCETSEIIKEIDGNTAGVLIQNPNFFGVFEDIDPIIQAARKHGAEVIVCANPLSYGLYPPADSDIAVGDTQPFGIPMNYGGPYVGYIACKEKLLRQLPGRIIGETVDTEGRRGFVLTLQAREQHIRRDKATSNICTNQALAAMASLIAMTWYGKNGISRLAKTNFQRAQYLRNQLASIKGIKLFNDKSIFNEFTISFERPVFEEFKKRGIIPGIEVEKYYPQLKNHLLVAVTETKSKEQLDKYIAVAKELLQ